MKHQIENERYAVQINEVGAELCSFKSKQSGLEYVWQGDAKYWGSTSPVLFPIIGALKNGVYSYKGHEYSIPKHGFIRHNENLTIDRKATNEVTFSYDSDAEVKKHYPFDFHFEITFLLEDNKLTVSHIVENKGTNEMLFSLGGHPAFNCPLLPNESYDDYYLEFDQEQTLPTTVLSGNGLQTDETFDVIQNSSRIDLTEDLFANDALIFKDIVSKKVALKNHQNPHSIEVTYFDFKNLGVWAKHKAPFICVEPWLGVTDHENTTGDFEKKEGVLSLSSNEVYHAKFEIKVS